MNRVREHLFWRTPQENYFPTVQRKIWLKKSRVSRWFPFVVSCTTDTHNLFLRGNRCNAWGWARVWHLTYLEMFYLILEFQTNVEIDNGKTTKILPPLLYAWIVPPGNTAAGCSKVNHPTKTIHHHNVQILYHGTLYRQTDRQTDRQAGRQTGRLTVIIGGVFRNLWNSVMERFSPSRYLTGYFDLWWAT